MDSKNITIYDVAREAGVSIATVSRVLSGSANVRPEKKEKVLEAVRRYNFTPNAMAQGLVNTKSNVIGMIVADVRNPYFAEAFNACEKQAEKKGYTILLLNSWSDTCTEINQLDKLMEQRVDAIVMLGGNGDQMEGSPEFQEKLCQITQKIPMIITGPERGTGCYQVKIDDSRSMDLVLEHLLSLGHREIAFVGGYSSIAATYEKKRRYERCMEERGISYPKEYVDNVYGYDAASGFAGMNGLLEKGFCPTAVIAINDYTAMGVLSSLHRHGYRVPEDIALASFDNTYIAEMATPQLTSVDYNYETIGEILIDTAIQLINGIDVPKIQIVEPGLIVRESTRHKIKNEND